MKDHMLYGSQMPRLAIVAHVAQSSNGTEVPVCVIALISKDCLIGSCIIPLAFDRGQIRARPSSLPSFIQPLPCFPSQCERIFEERLRRFDARDARNSFVGIGGARDVP